MHAGPGAIEMLAQLNQAFIVERLNLVILTVPCVLKVAYELEWAPLHLGSVCAFNG